jgi:uncharacterized surface anchored protein
MAAGCLGSSNDTNSAVHADGKIVMVGGPPPGTPRPVSGAEFRLVGHEGSESVRADRDGRFSVDLPPGTYRVVVTGHAPRTDRNWDVTNPSAVTISSSETAKPLLLVFSIK